MTRIELVTSSLPRKRSTPELHRRYIYDCRYLFTIQKKIVIRNSQITERETGFEPATFSLEGWRSTNWATPAIFIEIPLRKFQIPFFNERFQTLIQFPFWHLEFEAWDSCLRRNLWWGEQDSNLRRLSQQIYSLPSLAAWVSPQNRAQIYYSLLTVQNKKRAILQFITQPKRHK